MSGASPAGPEPTTSLLDGQAVTGTPATSGKSPLATWALVLGIVTIVFAIIPGLSFIAGLPGTAAVVLGAIALLTKRPRKGKSISGIALGGAGTLIAIFVSIGFIASLATADLDSTAAPALSESVEATPEVDSAEAEAAAQAAAEEQERMETEAAEARAAEEKEAEEQRVAAEAERLAAEELARGSVSQENALRSATNYLSFMAFSYSGLVDQLEFEGFTTDEAVWAVDRVDADWNEQAALSAKNYLEVMAFSRPGLIEQLVFEGFTQAQAEYGVDQTGL